MKSLLSILLLFLSFALPLVAQPFCDQPQGSAGFPSDLACQTAVCSQDAFCCENTWDSFCASTALITAACSECLSGQTLFCNVAYLTGGFPSDAACENAVCAIDDYCCSTQWDATCASLAQITPACSACLSPVENDNCVSAIEIIPSPTCNPITGDVQNATNSGLGPICGSFAYANDDLFYYFEAPGTGEVTIEIDPSGTDPMTLEVLQPSNALNECQGFWQVQCLFGDGSGNPQNVSVTGLTPGSNYYVRIYSEGEDPLVDGEFQLCIIGDVPPPPNDECSTAIEIIPSPVCTPVTGNVQNATDSGLAPFCGSGTANDDLFFYFDAPATGQVEIMFNPAPSGNVADTLIMEVYEALAATVACEGQSQSLPIACLTTDDSGDQQSMVLTGLEPGTPYLVRVYSASEAMATNGEFELCVSEEQPCNISIDPSAIQEYEVCGGSSNNGCFSSNYGFEMMPCNGLVVGQCRKNSPLDPGIDSDWYQFGVTESNVPVTATCRAEFPFMLSIYEVSDCLNPVLISSISGGPCELVTISEQLSTGTYALMVQPDATALRILCNSQYRFYELGLTRPTVEQDITSDQFPDFCQVCWNEDTVCSMTVSPGGVSYQWFKETSPENSPVPTNQQTINSSLGFGYYFVDVTDVNGCVVRSDLHHVQAHFPSIEYAITSQICGSTPGIVTIESTGPFPGFAEVIWGIVGEPEYITITGSPLDLPVPQPTYLSIFEYIDGNGCSQEAFGNAVYFEDLQSELSAAFTHVPGQGSQQFNSVANQDVTHNWTLSNQGTGASFTSTDENPLFQVDLGTDQWQMCHTVTSTEGNCSEEHCEILDNGVVGLNELQQPEVQVSPNPSDGTFWVQGPTELRASVSVYDLFGRIVFNENGFEPVNRYIETGLPVGTYLLRITAETGLQSSQLIQVSTK